MFTARHTRNVDTVLDDARTVLRLSTDWGEKFRVEAERMLRINTPLRSKKLSDVLNGVFPVGRDESSRQKKNREDTLDSVLSIYMNDRNAGGYGFNGWSLYNAIVEYLDHVRTDDKISNALASMDDTSSVTQKKLLTHSLVLH